MLPFVSPVAAVISEREVPAYPFLLKIGAVFSIMYCRVCSAFFTTQKYTIRYKLQNISCLTPGVFYIRFKLSHVRRNRSLCRQIYPPERGGLRLLPLLTETPSAQKKEFLAPGRRDL